MIKIALIAASAGVTSLFAVCHSWGGAATPPAATASSAPALEKQVMFVEGDEAEPPAWPPLSGPHEKPSDALVAASLNPASGLALNSLGPTEKTAAADVKPPKSHVPHGLHKPVTFARAQDGAIIPIVWNR